MPDTPKLSRSLGATVLIAAAVMFAALFVPFVTQGCINCAVNYTIPSRSLFQGLDGWVVFGVVVALALIAISYVSQVPHRAAALPSLGLAAVALALGLFERVDADGRVIGQDSAPLPAELGHPGAVLQGIAPPVSTDFGTYVFLGAAAVAVIAAAGIVLIGRSARTYGEVREAVPFPSAQP